MKEIFFTILGLAISVALIRFAYDMQTNTFSYSMQYLLSSMPNVKEDFEVVVDAFRAFADSAEEFSYLVNSDAGTFEWIQELGNVLLAFLQMIGSVFVAIGLVIVDVLKFIEAVFNLLFAPAVDPIASTRLIVG